MSQRRVTGQVSILCLLNKVEETRDIWLKKELINGCHDRAVRETDSQTSVG